MIIRLVFVLFSYFFYIEVANDYMGFGAADANTYHIFAVRGAEMIGNGEYNFHEQFNAMGFFSRGVDIADMGYPIVQSFLYYLTGNSRIISRCFNVLLSAWTVTMMYGFTRRNFGEKVARMTAIFCMLMPNLIFYCSMQLKETMMLWLTVAFIDRTDVLLRSSKATFQSVVVVVALGGIMYFFRAILSVVLFLTLFTALVLSSTRMVKWGRRVLIGLLIALLMGTTFWNVISENLHSGEYDDLHTSQQTNMEWRSERENGNQLAKYAGAVVFAPLIFTIPFPTMVDIPEQETQQLIHGGNYVKNITSFFTILALLFLLLSKKWKEHVLPAAFLCGYLVVLVFSNYAQSERFHIPILPFSLMFAAYGVSQMTNRHKLWFDWWMAFILVANIGWAWFKLRGRGM